MNPNARCLECGILIPPGVQVFSRRIYGHSLCIKDQCKISESGASARIIDLYLALKARRFPVVLQYNDHLTQIDIALPEILYVNIYESLGDWSFPVFSDYLDTVHDPLNNIPVILIPSSMLKSRSSFEYAVNEISKACRILQNKTVVTGMDLSFSLAQLQ